MKKLALLIMIMCFALHGKATNYADYVNPLIGTQSTYEFSSGNTYPAIARPWGMNFWTVKKQRHIIIRCIWQNMM